AVRAASTVSRRFRRAVRPRTPLPVSRSPGSSALPERSRRTPSSRMLCFYALPRRWSTQILAGTGSCGRRIRALDDPRDSPFIHGLLVRVEIALFSRSSDAGEHVTTLRLVPPPRVPALFARLRFDSDLEAQALRQLAGLDVNGCRATFGRLVDQLD